MTREEHLLAHVAEECGEVAQRAIKALKFGLQESQSVHHETNEVRLIEEFNDLVSVMRILHEEGYFKSKKLMIPNHLEYKKERIDKYLTYAKELGKLTK